MKEQDLYKPLEDYLDQQHDCVNVRSLVRIERTKDFKTDIAVAGIRGEWAGRNVRRATETAKFGPQHEYVIGAGDEPYLPDMFFVEVAYDRDVWKLITDLEKDEAILDNQIVGKVRFYAAVHESEIENTHKIEHALQENGYGLLVVSHAGHVREHRHAEPKTFIGLSSKRLSMKNVIELNLTTFPKDFIRYPLE